MPLLPRFKGLYCMWFTTVHLGAATFTDTPEAVYLGQGYSQYAAGKINGSSWQAMGGKKTPKNTQTADTLLWRCLHYLVFQFRFASPLDVLVEVCNDLKWDPVGYRLRTFASWFKITCFSKITKTIGDLFITALIPYTMDNCNAHSC